MNVKNIRQMLLALFGAVLFVLVVWAFSYKQKPLQYTVVLFGDSVVANDYVGKELNEILTDRLEVEVFNAGFGGSYMCNQNMDFYDTCGDESLSMKELSISIVTGDFLAQKTAIQRASRLDYYEERLQQLSDIAFDKTEMIMIEHGVNDYAMQISPKQFENTLRDIVCRFKKQYPDMKILISSPSYCYIVRDGKDLYCDDYEMGPYLLEEYIAIERKVCEEEDILFVDNYHNSPIRKETLMDYSLDGLHLNEKGRQLIADNIVNALKNNSEQ